MAFGETILPLFGKGIEDRIYKINRINSEPGPSASMDIYRVEPCLIL